MFGDYRSNGMNGLVPAQPFRSETSHCTDRGFVVFSKLIFNDRVEGGVDRHVGQLDAGSAMMFFHESNTYLLVKR